MWFLIPKNIFMVPQNTPEFTTGADKSADSQSHNVEKNKALDGSRGKLATLALDTTKVALAATLALVSPNPTKAETPNSVVATVVAKGDSIDNSKTLAQIEEQIKDIEAKIKNIEAKNELTRDDKKARYELKKQKRVLDEQRDAIRDQLTNNKKETIAIKTNEGKQLDDTIKNKLDGIGEIVSGY